MQGEEMAQATLGIVALFTEETGLLRSQGLRRKARPERSSRSPFWGWSSTGGCRDCPEKPTLTFPSWPQFHGGRAFQVQSSASAPGAAFVTLALNQAWRLVTNPVLVRLMSLIWLRPNPVSMVKAHLIFGG